MTVPPLFPPNRTLVDTFDDIYLLVLFSLCFELAFEIIAPTVNLSLLCQLYQHFETLQVDGD